jgi:hypothetical protein
MYQTHIAIGRLAIGSAKLVYIQDASLDGMGNGRASGRPEMGMRGGSGGGGYGGGCRCLGHDVVQGAQ